MLVALLALANGCSPAPGGDAKAAGWRDDLMAADSAFDFATAARGVEGWVSFVGDSGRQTDERGNFVTGPTAIRELMRGLLDDSTRALRWVPDLADVSHDGTLGYTWGRWTMTVKDSAGSHQAGQGRYLTVWQRNAEGEWKVAADLGTDTKP